MARQPHREILPIPDVPYTGPVYEDAKDPAATLGGITEIATSAPGYNSIRPNTTAPLAETLKLNGYATAQFGKCHEVPVWETSPMGPFHAWPTGSGFEHFYGFIGARPTSTHLRSTRTRSRSSLSGHRRRAITSPRT
jgi:arylsulfatase A-like enzyme